MRFSTIVLLAIAAIVFSATAVKAEEPERITGYDGPETTVVPLSSSEMSREVLAIEGEKSSVAKMENSIIYIDDNNRLVGLSN